MDKDNDVGQRVQEALNREELDLLVASSPENVAYTSGTAFLTQRTIPDRLALAVFPRNGDPILVYCTIEEQQAKHQSWFTEFVGYTEFADHPIDVLVGIIDELGLKNRRIGIEKRHLSANDYEKLVECLPDADLVAGDSSFDRLRAKKSTEEIKRLGQAALWTDAAIRTAYAVASVGDTEYSIGQRMLSEVAKHGASGLLHLVLATGSNGFQVHHEPGSTILQPGDVLRSDFGMYWGHYVSDIARTAIVGPARADQLETYKKLEDIQQTVIRTMLPGVKCKDVYAACAKAFQQRGLPFSMPHIGHSIGMGAHERPMLHPFEDAGLEPGMVLMLEPLVATHDGLYHTEDMVEITNSGNRVLSRSADWSQPFVIGEQ